MDFRVQLQLAEALGPLNRWFCSETYRRPIDNDELLVIYYIKSGGAEDFARRWDQAMGTLNRWYCSEFYRRDVREPQLLWDYYMRFGAHGALARATRSQPGQIALHIAC